MCGVDPELTVPQLKEAFRFIGHCWRGDTIEWDSELLQIHPPPDRPPHTVVPRPVQLPHPPLFLACTNPETVRRAAQYGVGPMVLGFGGPEAIGEMRRMFDEERATRDIEQVVSPGHVNDEFVALCPTFLMDDRDEAFAIGARALRFFAEAISHWAAPNGVAPGTRHRQDRQRRVHEGTPCGGTRGSGAWRGSAHRRVDALQPRPRARRRRHRDRLRATPRGRRCGQRDVPDPDGHAHPGPAARDDPPLGREGHPPLPRADA